MTVLLGSYSRSWCQSEIDNVVHPPRGVNTTNLANYGTRRKSKRINEMVYGYLWC